MQIRTYVHLHPRPRREIGVNFYGKRKVFFSFAPAFCRFWKKPLERKHMKTVLSFFVNEEPNEKCENLSDLSNSAKRRLLAPNSNLHGRWRDILSYPVSFNPLSHYSWLQQARPCVSLENRELREVRTRYRQTECLTTTPWSHLNGKTKKT